MALIVILAAYAFPAPNSFETRVLQSVLCILFQNNCITCLDKFRRKETNLRANLAVAANPYGM